MASSATTTVPLASSSGLPTDTAVVLAVGRVDSNGVDITAQGKFEVFKGVVSGNNINCSTSAYRGLEGTAQSHAAGEVVEYLATETVWNAMVTGILVEHNQDGTHKTTMTLPTTAVTLTGTQTLTNKTLTDSTNNVMAKSLKSATTTVDVAAATAPTTGQVLTATGASAATWQTPTAGTLTFATSGPQANFSTSATTATDVTGATVTINPTATATVDVEVMGRIYLATAGDNIHIALLIDGVIKHEYDASFSTANYGNAFALGAQASVASGARVIKMTVHNATAARSVSVDQANVKLRWK